MTAINKTAKELPQLPAGLVEQLANFVNTEQALRLITNQLMKQVVERTLQAELSHQIDSATGNANSRHGFMAKPSSQCLPFTWNICAKAHYSHVKGNFGELSIVTPRDGTARLNPPSCAKDKQDSLPLMIKP
jgi:hypothetical protein